MATDVARISFDRARRYTGTVPQQGRVSLEAEENEQHAIDHVERLRELLEIVGPAGTPDGGYAITDDGTGNPQIGPGTLYVGGLRVENDATFPYTAQPDWLDSDGDPDFVTEPTDGQVNEHAVLVLTDVDVTATEDPVLLETALGGPDGAARRRLLQRVRLIETTAQDCAGALRTDMAAWAAEGLTFDPKAMRLDSMSRLQVAWDGPPPKADPCEPTATGGYLGADNQAIMVKICAVDPQAGTFDVVWGWDNGSALYRVTADSSADPVLTLGRAPVDSYHNPQSGQPVELLRSAAELQSTDGVVEGYVASLTGDVAVLTAPYDPDLKQVVFPATPPSQYTDPTKTPQLYLRVWQELHHGVTPGTAITLTGTGITITISTSTGTVHLGDYWTIGVRPSTPNTVLPDRLLRAPQPPDGPRMWACPLAVFTWGGGSLTLLADCVPSFPPLTGITEGSGGCCTVSAQPPDAPNLQQIIDKAAAGRTVDDVSERITVCLSPGRYLLTAPLILRRAHSQLHLEGCGDGAVLAVEPGQESNFGDGQIVLLAVQDVLISGITFEPPPVDTGIGRSRKAAATSDMRTIDPKITAINRDRRIAIALRPVDCRNLSVERCVFSLAPNLQPTPPTVPSPPTTTAAKTTAAKTTAAADTTGAELDATVQISTLNLTYLAIGVLLGGFNQDVSVADCRFTGVDTTSTTLNASGTSTTTNLGEFVTFAVLTSPTLLREVTNGKATSNVAARVNAEIDGLSITGCEFDWLTAAVLSYAGLGAVRIEDNTALNCYAGFYLLSPATSTYLDLTGSYNVGTVDATTMDSVNSAVTDVALDPMPLLANAFARAYPLPSDYQPPANEVQQAGTSSVTPQSWTAEFVTEVTRNLPAPSTSTSTGAATDTAASSAAASTTGPTGQEEWRPSAQERQVAFGTGATSTAQLVAGGGPATTAIRAAAMAVRDYELAIAFPTVTTVFKLMFDGNRVECFQPNLYSDTGVAAELARTGEALVVWAFGEPTSDAEADASAIVNTNNLSSNSAGPAVLIITVPLVTVTGNLVLRPDLQGMSLALLGAGLAAITGNVLFGIPILPTRPYPAPLDTWLPMNSVL